MPIRWHNGKILWAGYPRRIVMTEGLCADCGCVWPCGCAETEFLLRVAGFSTGTCVSCYDYNGDFALTGPRNPFTNQPVTPPLLWCYVFDPGPCGSYLNDASPPYQNLTAKTDVWALLCFADEITGIPISLRITLVSIESTFWHFSNNPMEAAWDFNFANHPEVDPMDCSTWRNLTDWIPNFAPNYIWFDVHYCPLTGVTLILNPT